MPDDRPDATPPTVEAVFTEHHRFIESVARKHAYRSDDIPDIVQNVAVNLCRSLDRFGGRSNIKTWLFRVTANAARDHYRNESRLERTRAQVEALVQPMPVERPDEAYRRGQRITALRDAVSCLRPASRAVICNVLSESDVQGNRKADMDPQAARRQRTQRFRARHELRIRMANDDRLE